MLEIESSADLMPGDIGFYVISGRVGGWVALGQAVCDSVDLMAGRRADSMGWFTHAFMVLSNGRCIEAMPGGARIGSTLNRVGKPGWGYVRLPLSPLRRLAIDDSADRYVGTPYSFLDYASIALLHAGLPRKLTKSRVENSGHMICSQLVDHMLCAHADYHLFDDGRVSGDVTPGALFRRAGALGESIWW